MIAHENVYGPRDLAVMSRILAVASWRLGIAAGTPQHAALAVDILDLFHVLSDENELLRTLVVMHANETLH